MHYWPKGFWIRSGQSIMSSSELTPMCKVTTEDTRGALTQAVVLFGRLPLVLTTTAHTKLAGPEFF